jgi:protocatechuate 4,5-dioxygenase alpha subunit
MTQDAEKKSGFPSTIPGTKVFDYRQAQKGYELNMFFMSLNKAENRETFKLDPDKYMNAFPLTDEQRAAIHARDYNALLEMGGNIYFITKMIPIDGVSFQHVGAAMSGLTEQQFKDMLLSGGRKYDPARGA